MKYAVQVQAAPQAPPLGRVGRSSPGFALVKSGFSRKGVVFSELVYSKIILLVDMGLHFLCDLCGRLIFQEEIPNEYNNAYRR